MLIFTCAKMSWKPSPIKGPEFLNSSVNFSSRPTWRIHSCDFSEDSGLRSVQWAIRQRSLSHTHAIEWVLINCRIPWANFVGVLVSIHAISSYMFTELFRSSNSMMFNFKCGWNNSEVACCCFQLRVLAVRVHENFWWGRIFHARRNHRSLLCGALDKCIELRGDHDVATNYHPLSPNSKRDFVQVFVLTRKFL